MFQKGFSSMINRIKTVAVRFANDERGMEAIQIIMTLAIAAMVCLGVTKMCGVDSSGTQTGKGIFGEVGRHIGGFLGDKAGNFFGGFGL